MVCALPVVRSAEHDDDVILATPSHSFCANRRPAAHQQLQVLLMRQQQQKLLQQQQNYASATYRPQTGMATERDSTLPSTSRPRTSALLQQVRQLNLESERAHTLLVGCTFMYVNACIGGQ